MFLWKNGGIPTSISYNRIPRVQRSTVWSWPLFWSISGERYSAVPQKLLAKPPVETFVARPKSASNKYPSLLNNTFSGFKSLYTICFSCKCPSAIAIYAIINLAYSSGNLLIFTRCLNNSPPSINSIKKKILYAF